MKGRIIRDEKQGLLKKGKKQRSLKKGKTQVTFIAVVRHDCHKRAQFDSGRFSNNKQ